MIWHVGKLWQRKCLSLCWNTINTAETGRKCQNNAGLRPSSSDTQSSEHYVPPPLLLTPTSQRNQTDLIPDCAISWFQKRKSKVLHHLSTPGALQTLCLFARLLFWRVAANLAYYPGTTLVSAMSHLCQLHDCHDPGRQEYYTATWKESNTWTQLSARLSRNTDLFSASICKPPSSLSYGAHKWLGIV